MSATAGPGAIFAPLPVSVYPLPIVTLRHWAEVVAFAIDACERERVDALLELAESVELTLEHALGAAS